MTTLTKDNHEPEDKPVRRKKLSASNSSKKDNSSKGSKSKNLNSKIIDLINIASLDNKGLVKLAKEKKILKVVFDRNGYPFHGRVKAFADAAREEGLKF